MLDASATLAWLIDRVDPTEARLASETLLTLRSEDAAVPALWFAEIANGILVAERRGALDLAKSNLFLGMVSGLPIEQDAARTSALQPEVLKIARACRLTAYDATYLELALRTGRTLATFDRQLADAARKASARVFGDAP
ncbi:MAG: type II toxin-antitoxin system VapC family toxin [Terracidiphilus sp.]